jgi:zinc transporter, ZIP family
VSLLAAVALSNLPEGMASSSGLKAAKWPRSRVMLMWSAVVLVSALSAAAGYLLLDPASGRTGAPVHAFADGAGRAGGQAVLDPLEELGATRGWCWPLD